MLSDKLWLSDRGKLEHRQAAEFGLDRAEAWLDEHPDFEIIPRDPETYKDWQVGDVVTDKDGYYLEVAARLENIVFLSYSEKDDCSAASDAYYTCEELYKTGSRLVLTDYEQEIAEAKAAPECPFEKGDKVLARDGEKQTWCFGVFEEYNQNNPYPHYMHDGEHYRICIPYNEKTWKLLGTADDYKEEQLWK